MTRGAPAAPADQAVEACASENPDVMFPEDEHNPHSPEVQAARRVCLGCGIREACLERAIRERQPFGVWGGMTTPEREALRRRQYRRGPKPRERAGGPATAPEHAPAARWEDATLPFAV